MTYPELATQIHSLLNLRYRNKYCTKANLKVLSLLPPP